MKKVEKLSTCPGCGREIEGFAYPGRVGEAMDWICARCAGLGPEIAVVLP